MATNLRVRLVGQHKVTPYKLVTPEDRIELRNRIVLSKFAADKGHTKEVEVWCKFSDEWGHRRVGSLDNKDAETLAEWMEANGKPILQASCITPQPPDAVPLSVMLA